MAVAAAREDRVVALPVAAYGATLESGCTGPQMSISSHMDPESWDRKVEELSQIVAGTRGARF